MSDRELLQAAFSALENAYAPYSGYKVGAALSTDDGKIYTGCNVENASYTPTVCAERNAFFKAISDGKRSFTKIAVVGGKDGTVTDTFMPCGVCRQVMAEFCREDFKVIVAKNKEEYTVFTLEQLLPHGFSNKYMKDKV